MSSKVLLRRLQAVILGIAALVSAVGVTPAHAVDVKKLAPNYRQWIERDVAYIISKDERDTFLSLTTDQQRDEYIQHFWELRNPSPGAPENAYKDDIYKRIAYANQWFGTPGGDNGWRTDRGRIYIQLGEPKQRAKYYGASETRPFEIWFYENANPSLPPYFYIVFYQRDIGDEFRLYSPKFDGPDKIAHSSFATNNRKEAFNRIDKELGREVSRTTLSLIPGEPVDIDTAESSMSSDLMLAQIRNLPNLPLTKEMIKHNADLLSNVSHRIIMSGEYLDVFTTSLRDGNGDTYVHYLLRVKQPVDFSIVKDGDRYYYNADVSVSVRNDQGKLILSQNYPITRYVTDAEFQQVKSSAFGVEGVLPLPPGKYKAEMILTNKVKKSAWKVDRDIVVDGAIRSGLGISQLMGFRTVEPAGANFLPFSLGGLKFSPQASDELALAPGQPLTVMYQLWNTPEADATKNAGKKLHIEYTYGRLGASSEAKKIEEDVAMDQFDRYGSMITGKKLATDDMPNGNYRLVVAATDPDTGKKVFSSMSFRLTSTPPGPAWDVSDDTIPQQYATGVFDLQRGRALIALGRPDEAAPYLQRAYERNRADEGARDSLADLYFTKANYESVAKLYTNGGVTEKTAETTVLNFAQSFAKLGKIDNAINVLEAALHVKSASEPLYLALASYYDAAGNTQKSAEVKKKLDDFRK